MGLERVYISYSGINIRPQAANNLEVRCEQQWHQHTSGLYSTRKHQKLCNLSARYGTQISFLYYPL